MSKTSKKIKRELSDEDLGRGKNVVKKEEDTNDEDDVDLKFVMAELEKNKAEVAALKNQINGGQAEAAGVKVAAEAPKMYQGENNEQIWDISGKKKVSVSEFNGIGLVGIREFYQKDNKWLPTKKGISLTIEQFDLVLAAAPAIKAELAKIGGKKRR